jgi:hypothetical protein
MMLHRNIGHRKLKSVMRHPAAAMAAHYPSKSSVLIA